MKDPAAGEDEHEGDEEKEIVLGGWAPGKEFVHLILEHIATARWRRLDSFTHPDPPCLLWPHVCELGYNHAWIYLEPSVPEDAALVPGDPDVLTELNLTELNKMAEVVKRAVSELLVELLSASGLVQPPLQAQIVSRSLQHVDCPKLEHAVEAMQGQETSTLCGLVLQALQTTTESEALVGELCQAAQRVWRCAASATPSEPCVWCSCVSEDLCRHLAEPIQRWAEAAVEDPHKLAAWAAHTVGGYLWPEWPHPDCPLGTTEGATVESMDFGLVAAVLGRAPS